MIRVLCGAFCFVVLFAGCSGNEVQVAKEQRGEDNQMATILGQLLQEKPTLGIYRSVVEQLNSYYDHPGIEKMMPMPKADEELLRKMLSEQKSDFDRARRVDEVKNRFFNTLSDASYIDSCLLFQDAITALINDMGETPSKNNPQAVEEFQMGLVKHAFGWTMRQVALRTNPTNIKDWPANEILRLGAGNADDRLRVFLSLLNQSDLDSCAVIIKTQVRQDNVVENRQVPILAGVLVGKSVYLFDPYNGLPVPGPTPGSIATYQQLKQTPTLLAARPDGPTPTQINESELVLMSPINGLAPRMKILEKDFDDMKITVKLKDDAAARLEHFRNAGYIVNGWAAPNRSGFPALVFQNYVENAKGDPRLTEDILPRAKLIPKWALDAEKQIGMTGTQQSFFYDFDRMFVRLRLEPAGGRDLLVRGKPHQAVANLSKLENRLDRSLDMYHKDVTAQITVFRETFVEPLVNRSNELRQITQELNAQSKDSQDARQLETKRRQLINQLQNAWKEQSVKSMVVNMAADWAIPELREHISYFMGLAKMELAIRAEMRYLRNPKAPWPAEAPTPAEQFAAASEWFRRYEALVIPMKSNVWLDAVKLRHQECKDRQAKLEQLVAQSK